MVMQTQAVAPTTLLVFRKHTAARDSCTQKRKNEKQQQYWPAHFAILHLTSQLLLWRYAVSDGLVTPLRSHL